jgi:hypothetical protein
MSFFNRCPWLLLFVATCCGCSLASAEGGAGRDELRESDILREAVKGNALSLSFAAFKALKSTENLTWEPLAASESGSFHAAKVGAVTFEVAVGNAATMPPQRILSVSVRKTFRDRAKRDATLREWLAICSLKADEAKGKDVFVRTSSRSEGKERYFEYAAYSKGNTYMTRITVSEDSLEAVN